MKDKLIQLFESLKPENQVQILDYTMMLWEMEQGERHLSERLGIGSEDSAEELNKMVSKQYLKDSDKKDIN